MKTLIIADIHGNAPALQAVFDEERTWDQVIFLGDAVFPGAFPNETADLLRVQKGVFIAGNHDKQILTTAITDKMGCLTWGQWTKRILTETNLNFLSSMPFMSFPKDVEIDGKMFRLHHGDFSLCHDWNCGYFLPCTPVDSAGNMDEFSGCQVVLFGHSHVQFQRQIGNTLFYNPGSVGQPRLGQIQADYAVIKNGLLEHRSVLYDIKPVLARLKTLPISSERKKLAEQRLLSGFYWKKSPWTDLAAQGYR